MRSELFEEAWKQNRHVWESTKCLAQAMYLAAYQHQQSKVDELQQELEAQREETIKGYTKISNLRLERDELQKRVDDCIHQAKEFIQSCKVDADIFEDKYQAKVAYGAEAVVELLEQALKGGCDASN